MWLSLATAENKPNQEEESHSYTHVYEQTVCAMEISSDFFCNTILYILLQNALWFNVILLNISACGAFITLYRTSLYSHIYLYMYMASQYMYIYIWLVRCHILMNSIKSKCLFTFLWQWKPVASVKVFSLIGIERGTRIIADRISIRGRYIAIGLYVISAMLFYYYFLLRHETLRWPYDLQTRKMHYLKLQVFVNFFYCNNSYYYF